MKQYLNARTIVMAAVGVIAVVAVYPAALNYLPFLIFLACPLMMFFMHGGHSGHQTTTTRAELGEHVCPMHSDVRSTFPGKCPLCGMELEVTTSVPSGHH